MTDGTSQGLFIVVAIVIFGIFVGLAYTAFGEVLQPKMVTIFETALDFKVEGGSEGTPEVPVEPEVEVVFEDANLEKSVKEELGIATDEPLTTLKMEKLTSLSALGKGIKSLKGIEYAVNIKSLRLYANDFTDLSPLKNLTKLTSLDVSRNGITDITAVENLTNLTNLNIGLNNISNLKPIINLTNLKVLSASSNKIVDLESLSGLTNLNVIYLMDNQIRNVTPLSNLKNLVELNLYGNKITDFTPVDFVTKLDKTGQK